VVWNAALGACGAAQRWEVWQPIDLTDVLWDALKLPKQEIINHQ